MPKANEPKPKPWRGWAVFDVSGEIVPWSISDANSTAWNFIKGNTGMDRKALKSLGYTVRRVVVTPEESK